jgi:mannitol-1-/sugar-/sorbitol-6-phosphatase
MDGTLITSIEPAERVWTRWAARHGLDARTFLSSMHGRRAVDTIRSLGVPGMDAVAEAELVSQWEIDDTEGVRAIAGAREFVASLPLEQWAIVTSAPRALAVRRLEAAGVALPRVLVTAEEVTVGKPDPSGYRLAAERLSVDAADCAIFEDADAGIRAGEAAGGQVIVITATHAHPLATKHPAFRGFDEIEPQISQGRIALSSRSLDPRQPKAER